MDEKGGRGKGSEVTSWKYSKNFSNKDNTNPSHITGNMVNHNSANMYAPASSNPSYNKN